MSNLSNKDFLLLRAKIPRPFPLTVEGTSMLPILHPGDIVNVCAKENYSVGDILVFFYKEDALLVHRLLKVENGRYFCKGDHSFRLEDMEKKDIVGTVLLESDPNNTPEFLAASMAVHRIFRKCGYNAEITKLTPEYAEYANKYLGENK